MTHNLLKDLQPLCYYLFSLGYLECEIFPLPIIYYFVCPPTYNPINDSPVSSITSTVLSMYHQESRYVLDFPTIVNLYESRQNWSYEFFVTEFLFL